MKKTKEIFSATTRTLTYGVERLVDGEGIHIPRTSLAIFDGLYSSYQKEIEQRGGKEAFGAMSDLAPVLVALNEITDIGFSVDMVNANSEASKLVFKLNEYLRSWTDKFIEKYPGHKDTIGKLVNDFCLLSLMRKVISTDQIPTYLELDSLILEMACVRIVTQNGWKDNGTKKAVSFDDLVTEYGEYLICQCNKGLLDKEVEKLRALHALEMVMKIRDDMEGNDVDKKLGIPNFYEYARITAGGNVDEQKRIINDLRKGYIDEAQKGGYDRVMIGAIELLQHVSGLVRDKIVRNRGGVSLFEVLPESPKTTTTLRHILMKKTDFLQLLNRV